MRSRDLEGPSKCPQDPPEAAGTRDALGASPDGPEEVIRIRDAYYILATSALADDRTRVLKDGETFAVFDRYGDIHPVGHGQYGLYHDSTRFLSRLELQIAGERPILLSSTVREDNALVTADVTNPDLRVGKERILSQDSVHVARSITLWAGACHQQIRIQNYRLEKIQFTLSLVFEADFADIFEVRGAERIRSGKPLAPVIERDRVLFRHQGLDGVTRWASLRFTPPPTKLSAVEARYALALEPKGETVLSLSAACTLDAPSGPGFSYTEAVAASTAALKGRERESCKILTSNEQFNDWIHRSAADLRMMLTETPQGLYPYAGVPWFSAPFGRDGIVTALETLWMNPSIAAGVLRFLAETQADETRPETDAEPGKILHEARGGEMAALGEVPFARYYGSVDATPLFVMLAHAYYQRTGDRTLIEAIWPNLERALEWMDRYGDADGDGFVEYVRRSPAGLVNQGWKDSHDSVFHADGSFPEGPIALCEVQAYVYGAKRGAAELAAALGEHARASTLVEEARALRERFEKTFWSDELGTYVLALDGQKRPCRVRSSNAGHCLLTGIAEPEHAAILARTLMEEDAFSGWGIRTIAASEARYNPMAYHNGSVWPHDNALIAAGLARYGQPEPVLRILASLFDASLFVDLHRLPELFCGFPRRPGEGPTLYPVACAPQAWASGALFLVLQACLGLSISGRENRILFQNPLLPAFLENVQISNLRVGNTLIDLELRRHPGDVSIEVRRRDGPAEIVIVK